MYHYTNGADVSPFVVCTVDLGRFQGLHGALKPMTCAVPARECPPTWPGGVAKGAGHAFVAVLVEGLLRQQGGCCVVMCCGAVEAARSLMLRYVLSACCVSISYPFG